jgi:NADH-quinone oxidoreductase subunit K
VIPPEFELALSALLLCIGLWGIVRRRNAIVVLMSIEIVVNAAIMNLVAFSSYTNDPNGQLFALLGIAVAAAESAIGVAIFLTLFKARGTIELDRVRLLRW